jgi:3-hydroxyisobutyrate dehydrogenase-like beta-hydroxyacid dehydrogenase
MRVAFLGTEIMGAPMARNVRAAGHGEQDMAATIHASRPA